MLLWLTMPIAANVIMTIRIGSIIAEWLLIQHISQFLLINNDDIPFFDFN